MRRAQASPALILAMVSLPVFIGALDLTIISAVLPAVIADLNVSIQTGLDDAAWAITGYLLAYAVSMTFMGRVSDLWGAVAYTSSAWLSSSWVRGWWPPRLARPPKRQSGSCGRSPEAGPTKA